MLSSLRNWAVHPEDSVLTLEEIAHRILDQDEDPKAIAGSMDDAPQTRNWRRVCAEFTMTDLNAVAFRFGIRSVRHFRVFPYPEEAALALLGLRSSWMERT